MNGLGTLIVGRLDGEVVSDWISTDAVEILRRSNAWQPPAGSGLALPISYADVVLGELRLDMSADAPLGEAGTELLRDFAHECALLVKRYDVGRWCEQRLGRSLLLVGMSKALRELERFVEISARHRLPVLLRGEFGTEKAQLAAAIHFCSSAAEGPFVEVDCADPQSSPAKWVEQARGGTLYLSDIDDLDPSLQRQLPRYLPSRLHHGLSAGAVPPVGVIASTTADLRERARQGLFSRRLLAEIDFLSATVPPLRERIGDIEPLVWQALERNGYNAREKTSEILLSLCRMHDWPENLVELDRLITRLAVMTEGRHIELRDIGRHAPAMLNNLPSSRADAGGDDFSTGILEANGDRWVRCAIEGGGPRLRGLHDALRRAVLHLGAHYEEPVTLSELADRAGVSASHLGHLFRSGIGMSFKALLGRIRVAKARELLIAERARTITDIALSVGFSDLGNFERSFRRIVGQNPRDFRRSVRAG